jgi:hypothetical protein
VPGKIVIRGGKEEVETGGCDMVRGSFGGRFSVGFEGLLWW